MEQFDRVVGIFKPKVLSTLRNEMIPLIGKKFIFQALWLVSERDGGPYVGQCAMQMLDTDGLWLRGVGWVPEEDVEVLKIKPLGSDVDLYI